MKKTIVIALTLIFALFAGNLWAAGNGAAMKDGSMLDIDLSTAVVYSGFVADAGASGSGLTLDSGDTIYGMGPLAYWDSLGVIKPVIGDQVLVEAVAVTFSDGSTRLIAVSVEIDGEVVLLRTEDGPAWRGGFGGGSGTGDGTCLLTAE